MIMFNADHDQTLFEDLSDDHVANPFKGHTRAHLSLLAGPHLILDFIASFLNLLTQILIRLFVDYFLKTALPRKHEWALDVENE